MADLVQIVTFSGVTVTPLDDAIIYESALGEGGVKYGCTVTIKDANTLHIAGGHGVLCGRKFTIFDGDIPVQLSSSGTLLGRVYLQLDLSNVTAPGQILVETGASLTPPIQDANVNIINGTYEINLATFDVGTSAISNVVNVFPLLHHAGNVDASVIRLVPQAAWALTNSGEYENILSFGEIYSDTPSVTLSGASVGVAATKEAISAFGLLVPGMTYVETDDKTLHLFAYSAPTSDFYILVQGVGN